MNQNLEHLVVLQAIDLEIRALEAELAEVPKRLARAQAERAAAESALEKNIAAQHREEALRRSQESDAATHRGKIARLRKQMETATSAAQITALEHEIGFAEREISHIEDEEIASLERSEQFEEEAAAAQTLLERSAATLSTERERGAETQARASAALAERKAERTQLTAQTDDSLLSTYSRVSKARGTGVSEALDHKCSACQMMVRPQRWNDLTGREHDDQIFTCETCGRILFWDPRRDTPGSWQAGERLAHAQAHLPEHHS